MEARAKAMRQMILSSSVKLEDSNKDKSYYTKEDLFGFSKETKEDSEDIESPSKKGANLSTSLLKGKYFQWFLEPSQRKFTRLSSESNFSAKGKGAAKTISSPLEAWSLLFSDDVLNIILKYTNQKIRQKRNKRNWSCFDMFDMLELKAIIGLIYLNGSRTQKKKVPVHENFTTHSLPLFKETTSKPRLEFFFSKLSLYDKTTHDERIEFDRFTQISEIWNLFITNCIQYYEPGYNVTIDEQIFSHKETDINDIILFNGVSFIRELKFVTMNDSETFYMINAIPYINLENFERLEMVQSYYVDKISEPIHNTCRNITYGSWSISVPFAHLMRDKFALTMVGSLQKNESTIPPLFKSALAKEACQFAYHDNKTVVSYKPKNDKMILLLSSLHSDGKINKAEDKPEIVLYYNKTMGACDTFHHLCREYTVSRETPKWQIRIFYSMLDQAAVNSFVLYTLNANNQVITRDRFLLELSMALIKPYLIRLLSRPNLHILVQYRLKSFLNEHDFPEKDPRNLRLNISNKSKPARCYLCPTSKRIYTRSKCLKCTNSMCPIHEASICLTCAENQFFNHSS